jgi:hypothetical protein
MRAVIGATCFGLAALAISEASANPIIADGTFSAGANPASAPQNYIDYTVGQTIDNGNWFVLDNSVDVIASETGAAYGWPTPSSTPSPGPCCSVDLVGAGPQKGGIYQAFQVPTAGTYAVTFFYGNNFWSTGYASANVEVGTTMGGNNIATEFISHSTSSFSAMNWTEGTLYFTILPSAASDIFYLSFDTVFGAYNGGIALTDVSIIDPAPLPAAFALFAGGLGVIGLFARRKKTKSTAATSAA